jgi:hypothetical protein
MAQTNAPCTPSRSLSRPATCRRPSLSRRRWGLVRAARLAPAALGVSNAATYDLLDRAPCDASHSLLRLRRKPGTRIQGLGLPTTSLPIAPYRPASLPSEPASFFGPPLAAYLGLHDHARMPADNADDLYEVMIRCPRTGAAVWTSMLHTLESWAAAYQPQQVTACTSCGRVHYWTKAEAWLHKRRNRPSCELFSLV